MKVFKASGTINVEIQVECRDETRARKMLEDRIEVITKPYDKVWDHGEYMEVVDSTFEVDDFEIELEETETTCPNCYGSGGGPEDHLRCRYCNGSGVI